MLCYNKLRQLDISERGQRIKSLMNEEKSIKRELFVFEAYVQVPKQNVCKKTRDFSDTDFVHIEQTIYVQVLRFVI